jgi:light-regulated signal transduction histidine kinase (bacteriophytochrome)
MQNGVETEPDEALLQVLHELNNALARAALYSELLSEEVNDNKQATTDAQETMQAVRAAQELVRQLFAQSGVDVSEEAAGS